MDAKKKIATIKKSISLNRKIKEVLYELIEDIELLKGNNTLEADIVAEAIKESKPVDQINKGGRPKKT